MRRSLRATLFLLLALPATSFAQYVDTTARKPYSTQLALTSTFMLPENRLWRGDSLSCESIGFSSGSIGLDAMQRYRPSLLLGFSISTTRAYADAIHWRSSTYASSSEWVVYGERMGLDQRFTLVGPQAAYEPWHYPRRRKVGMTVQLGAGLYYVHFSEKRYILLHGVAEANSSSGRAFYSYAAPEDKEVLGRSSASGVCGMLWLRAEIHFGRRIGLYYEVGTLRSSTFRADGASHTTIEGTVLSILPHRTSMGWLFLRSGFAVYI